MSNEDIKVSSTLKFLGDDLELPEKDRTDPITLMFISQIELVELKYGDGLVWYRRLKTNYGLQFGNQEVESRIEDILIKNRNRGIK